jgi:NitT/TauT family transport system substrate-binding protein
MYYKKNNLLLEKNLSEIVFMKMSLFVRTAFITLLLVVFLPACSGSGVAQPTPEPVKVKVLSMPYITFAPFFIAQDEGYFAEQGLEVEFVQFDGLSTAIPALAQGEIDVVSGHIRASIFSAITGGAEIKVVADKGYVNPTGCADTAILARKSLLESGGLKSPAQLAGLKVSVDLTNYEGYLMDQILTPAGLTIDDVELVDDIPSSTQSEVLGSGAVDVLFSAEPWLTRILGGGNASLWIAPKECIPDFEYGVVLYGPSFLTKDPEAGNRFMLAYLKGVQQYNQGKTDRNIEILSKYTELDADILNAACWPSVRLDGSINLKSILDFQKWALGKGYISSVITSEQLWDPQFSTAAFQKLNTTSP